MKLIDFGIARDTRQESENDKDTHIAGTKPYMAPEQFGSEQTDNRADIYSLGVAMIFMATGKPDKMNLRTAYPYKELIALIVRCNHSKYYFSVSPSTVKKYFFVSFLTRYTSFSQNDKASKIGVKLISFMAPYRSTK